MAAVSAELCENEIKASFTDLTKIPEKEFEKHFRDWLDRDNVARGLQAKLRCDLISNFNKTSLGKQILAQTTTTTNRLTLSPIVLALNTLVAEFLYAQNCHFSLSVFCTEVPFRNTLPNFENEKFFRFTEAEIVDILQAISVHRHHRHDWKAGIIRNYLANTKTSLLYLVLKALLQRNVDGNPKTITIGVNTLEASTPPISPKAKTSKANAQQEDEVNLELYNTNFRYLNKYLIVLSKKVKEMSRHFESLKDQRWNEARVQSLPRFQVRKSANARRYENLNKSLERITQNLKNMTHTKRKSKQVGAILEGIEGLSEQFAKCAVNFECVSKKLISAKKRVVFEKAAVMHPRSFRSELIQTETQTEAVEKTYMDWIHDMRYTANGQKFLDRIEATLRKALDKQKQNLEKEMEVKLLHQKELLKIHYKQKLLQELSKHTDLSEVARRTHGDIEQQLKSFEEKHTQLLHKITEVETQTKGSVVKDKVNENATYTAAVATVVSAPKPPTQFFATSTQTTQRAQGKLKTTPQKPNNKSLINDALNARKQLQNMVLNIAEQGRNVDQIVYNAKLRIQELENESNQLDRNFQEYLERQRREKEEARQAAEHLWHDYVTEREKMPGKYFADRTKASKQSSPTNCESERGSSSTSKTLSPVGDDGKADPSVLRKSEFTTKFSNSDLNDIEFHNAIEEAKLKFFEQDRHFKEKAERFVLDSVNAKTYDLSEGKSEIGRKTSVALKPAAMPIVLIEDVDDASNREFFNPSSYRNDKQLYIDHDNTQSKTKTMSYLTVPSNAFNAAHMSTSLAITTSTTPTISVASDNTISMADYHYCSDRKSAINSLATKENPQNEHVNKLKQRLRPFDSTIATATSNTTAARNAITKNSSGARNKTFGVNKIPQELSERHENNGRHHQSIHGCKLEEQRVQSRGNSQLIVGSGSDAQQHGMYWSNSNDDDGDDDRYDENEYGEDNNEQHTVATYKKDLHTKTSPLAAKARPNRTASVLEQTMEKMQKLFDLPNLHEIGMQKLHENYIKDNNMDVTDNNDIRDGGKPEYNERMMLVSSPTKDIVHDIERRRNAIGDNQKTVSKQTTHDNAAVRCGHDDTQAKNCKASSNADIALATAAASGRFKSNNVIDGNKNNLQQQRHDNGNNNAIDIIKDNIDIDADDDDDDGASIDGGGPFDVALVAAQAMTKKIEQSILQKAAAAQNLYKSQQSSSNGSTKSETSHDDEIINDVVNEDKVLSEKTEQEQFSQVSAASSQARNRKAQQFEVGEFTKDDDAIEPLQQWQEWQKQSTSQELLFNHHALGLLQQQQQQQQHALSSVVGGSSLSQYSESVSSIDLQLSTGGGRRSRRGRHQHQPRAADDQSADSGSDFWN